MTRKVRVLENYEVTVTVTSVQHWEVKAENEAEASNNYEAGEMLDEDQLVEVTEIKNNSRK